MKRMLILVGLLLFLSSCLTTSSTDLTDLINETECSNNVFDIFPSTDEEKLLFVGASSENYASSITSCPSGQLDIEGISGYLLYFVFPDQWEKSYWDGNISYGGYRATVGDGVGYELIPEWCQDGTFEWTSSAGLPGGNDDLSFIGKCIQEEGEGEGTTPAPQEWCKEIEIKIYNGSEGQIGSGTLISCE
ncbi:hypothetical protein CO172_03865 [Candidatus Uhrbacteria bacterium CG_4_9_14_3_um_filter_36_7]|uniref:Lipoprotein n=1 Tax=Candidatus Uhrbacteria bacterium CG_4_9_14_3_um_filter_36_7 TaxID=1975033 RepID=A0A2M7XEN6_9BACT|nr:MAG: hypothetical protein CO172_03865 [Candidatus Uhrbacteria bacterium CG_4_9_14_3_um_filter_36_7]